MNPAPRSIVFGASVAAVVGAVVVGLVALGSPAEERERRIDDRRVADLHGIAAAVDLYRSRHSRLPASLDELAAEPGSRIGTRDPASSESYGYEALDSVRYELCATFDRESRAMRGEPATVPPVVQLSCRGCHGPGPVAGTPVGGPVAAHPKLRDLWAHRGGRQCFRISAQAAGW